MSDNVEVGRGLNRIFIGQLLVIVAMIVATIPPAGLFAVAAALVLPMMGLYQAGRVDKGYHMAFVLSVVARVSGLLCRSIGVPDLLGYILEFAVVYLVCTKTARRLETCPRQPGGGLCGNSMRPAWRSRSSPASLCQSWARGWLASCWLHWSLRWRTPSSI